MGKLIAVEGLDGAGKGTQSKLLYDDLLAQGKNVRIISFPDYESPASDPVKMYLSGEFGARPGDVNAYAASAFFAVDRYASYKKDWGEFLESEDAIIIANRYTTSNAIHQLSKLERDDWDEYLRWLSDFEFEKLGIPAPDMVLFLDVKPEITSELVKARCEKENIAADIHEADSEYLQLCYKAANYACDKLGWTKIQCTNERGILTVEEIRERIQEKITMYLDVAE